MSGKQTSLIYATLWIGFIVSPLLAGQLADRYFHTENFLAVVHLAGGIVLLLAARQKRFWPLFGLMGLYSLLYAPTVALTSSLMFRHVLSSDAAFGVRVWGTIGWIMAGWGLSLWRQAVRPSAQTNDCLLLSGVLSFLMGALCRFLPDTPPPEQPTSPWAFAEAFRLLADPNFLVFLLISFVVTTELQFYYIPTAPFLEDLGVSSKNVPAIMTIAQIAEVAAMFFMFVYSERVLAVLGYRWCFVIGILAWPGRYLMFTLMRLPLVIPSLALHGIGWPFFLFLGQVYVAHKAPQDIVASAQALFFLATLGLGNFLGTQFTGLILDIFRTEKGKFRWRPIFLIPCALTIACALAFLIFFRG